MILPGRQRDSQSVCAECDTHSITEQCKVHFVLLYLWKTQAITSLRIDSFDLANCAIKGLKFKYSTFCQFDQMIVLAVSELMN